MVIRHLDQYEETLQVIQNKIGERTWFNLEDILDQVRSAGGESDLSYARVYKIMCEIKRRLNRRNDRLVLEGVRGKGYRLWPRKELEEVDDGKGT